MVSLFFLKVNKDTVFRKNFLTNPVKVLANEGISLNPKAEREVKAITEVLLRKLPELSVVPTGFDVLLEEVVKQARGEVESSKCVDNDPPMLIL